MAFLQISGGIGDVPETEGAAGSGRAAPGRSWRGAQVPAGGR